MTQTTLVKWTAVYKQTNLTKLTESEGGSLKEGLRQVLEIRTQRKHRETGRLCLDSVRFVRPVYRDPR